MQAEDVRISRQATQITLNEYKAGTQAFTAVVTAETQQLGAEELLLSTQGQLQADAVNLIVALGGRLEPIEVALRDRGELRTSRLGNKASGARAAEESAVRTVNH